MKRLGKDSVQTMLVWAVIFWVACLVGVLVDWLLCGFVDGFVRNVGDYTAAILHTVFMGIGATGAIFALSFFLGYHDAGFFLSELLTAGIGGGVLQLLVGLLLKFPRWITGGVLWLSGLLEYGADLRTEELGSCTLWSYLLGALIMLAVFLLAMLLGHYLGFRRRIQIRIQLTGSEEDPCKKE